MDETDKGLGAFQGDLNRPLGDLLRELHESRREIARLRAENQELGSKLGLRSPSPAAGTEAPYHSTTHSSADVHSSLEHKIALIRSLFRGREDVYAVRWTSTRTGKTGYSPAVRGGWAAAKNRPKSFLPLTDEVLESHLTGETPIGIYPLLRDDTCRFLACDFDGDGWALDAATFLAAAGRHDVAAYIERSRSGAGGHVWIFFTAPVSAVAARRLAAGLLREAMVERGEIDLESYDRLFPNQDFLPKGSFGNLIALPLDGRAREQENTEFIDPGTHEPFSDQWAFLAEVARLSPKDLDQALTSLPPVKVGPDALKAHIRITRNRLPAPDTVPCTQRAMLSVQKSGLPPWLLSDIKHLASVHNPQFYEHQRLRLSTFKIPRFVRCYHEDLTHIHLPRGLLEQLEELLRRAGSRLDLRDDRVVPDEIGLSFSGNLMPAQEDAVDSLLEHDLGVLVAPPGVGKTVMACSVIAHRSVPTIVLLHRKPLLDQWRAQICELLDLPSSAVGQIGGGRNKPTGVVDLAMIQSLARSEDLEELFGAYGLVVVDECHHLPAVSFEAVVRQAPGRYFLGLTATPYRRDGLEGLISMQCGPIRHRIDASGDPTEELSRELLIRQTDFSFETTEDTSIQEVFAALVADEARNKLICEDVLDALANGRRCLILSQRREHCRILDQLLRDRDRTPLVVDGSLGKKARDEILLAIDSASSGTELCVISTGQYLGEGFDCPQLDTLFLAFPVSFKGRIVQYAGRLLRTHEGKSTVTVYDYADPAVPVLERMHTKRVRAYKGLGFPKVNQPGGVGA